MSQVTEGGDGIRWRRILCSLAVGGVFSLWTAARVAALGAKPSAAIPLSFYIGLEGLVVALFAYWAAATWHRLAPKSTGGPHADLVHRMGVLGWGGLWSALMAADMAVSNRSAMGEPWGPIEALAYQFTLSAIIALPIGLWGGYWWGRIMAGIFRVPRGR